MHKQPRMATVVAKGENASAWRLASAPFNAILLKTEHKLTVQLLRKVRALHALHGNQIDRIADMVTEMDFNSGDKVVSKGDALQHFYIVKHGSFVATSSAGNFDLAKTDFSSCLSHLCTYNQVVGVRDLVARSYFIPGGAS